MAMRRSTTVVAGAAAAKSLGVGLLLLSLEACGGRLGHPVAAVSATDEALSCEHLRAERRVNDARIADLEKERGNAAGNSFGMFLVNPLFMDFSRSEAKEIE